MTAQHDDLHPEAWKSNPYGLCTSSPEASPVIACMNGATATSTQWRELNILQYNSATVAKLGGPSISSSDLISIYLAPPNGVSADGFRVMRIF